MKVGVVKIQTTKALEAEMRAVARGELPTPADAALPSALSAEDQLALAQAVLNPPEPGPALIRAAAAHRRLIEDT